jgi:hypothetical protein
MKQLFVAILTTTAVGCATLTEDAMTPIAMSFSDGSAGECHLTNKRGAWSTEIPATVSVRKSDDVLKYQCSTADGREAVGSIASEMGAKIVASAVFLDLGITDAITDKHRQYTPSFVIPVPPKKGELETEKTTSGQKDVYTELETLSDLRDRGILTEEEFKAAKKRLLEDN